MTEKKLLEIIEYHKRVSFIKGIIVGVNVMAIIQIIILAFK